MYLIGGHGPISEVSQNWFSRPDFSLKPITKLCVHSRMKTRLLANFCGDNSIFLLLHLMLFQRQDQFCICIKYYNSIFVEIKFNIIKGNVKYFET